MGEGAGIQVIGKGSPPFCGDQKDGSSPVENLAPFSGKVLHRVSRPSGSPQSCLPVRNTQEGACSLAGQAHCSAVTLEGGLPPSNCRGVNPWAVF